MIPPDSKPCHVSQSTPDPVTGLLASHLIISDGWESTVWMDLASRLSMPVLVQSHRFQGPLAPHASLLCNLQSYGVSDFCGAEKALQCKGEGFLDQIGEQHAAGYGK